MTVDYQKILFLCECASYQSEEDRCTAEYIAAVPPEVVRELIEENLNLRAWAQRIAESCLEFGIDELFKHG